MENTKVALVLITGTLTVIGACLPWWTVVDVLLGSKTTVNFNPIFGHALIPTTLLSVVVGLLTLRFN